MDLLTPFVNFFTSIGDFIQAVFDVIYYLFTLVSLSFPPIFISLFAFGLLALFLGVIIRLL